MAPGVANNIVPRNFQLALTPRFRATERNEEKSMKRRSVASIDGERLRSDQANALAGRTASYTRPSVALATPVARSREPRATNRLATSDTVQLSRKALGAGPGAVAVCGAQGAVCDGGQTAPVRRAGSRRPGRSNRVRASARCAKPA